MAKFLLTISLLCVAFCCLAQENKIDTDRPDQTESAATVPKNYFQVELGFNKENTFFNNYNLVYPTALLKYGLKRIELRLETAFLSSYEQHIPQPKWTTGFEPVEIGCKALLFEEKKFIPKTSVIVHLGLPALASKSFRYDHLAPMIRFTLQKNFNSRFGLGTNLGAEWDGTDNMPYWIYTFSPGFNIGDRWYTYIEAFGFIQKDQPPQHNIDSGIAYYISNNVKIDFSAGLGLSEASPKNYFALGFSFRISAKGQR